MFLASMTVVFEHTVNGLVLPGLYLYTHNVVYYNIALYGEIAYMIYTTILIVLSYILKRDVTVEQMHSAVWPMLLVHHVGALFLCAMCIMQGDSVPRDLVCGVLLALLGLTSSLHYVGQILDFSPLAWANAPYARFGNHVFCLASQVCFRAIYWMHILCMSIRHAFETQGMGAAIAIGLIFLLFTAFNVDFIKFHAKATKGCWLKISETKLGKNC